MNEAKCETKQIIHCGRLTIEVDLDTGQYGMRFSLGGGYIKRPNGVPFEVAKVECHNKKDPPFTKVDRFILVGAEEVLELEIPDPYIGLRVLPKK